MAKLLYEIHIAQKSGDRGKRSCDCAQTQGLTSITEYQSHNLSHCPIAFCTGHECWDGIALMCMYSVG